jgi:fumarate hydratase subunit alpha
MMRIIHAQLIKDIVKELALKANIELRKDIFLGLKRARKNETNKKARRILDILIQNASIAQRKKLPICQDTGMAVVYLKIGQDVHIKGDLKKAVSKGIGEAYKKGYLRNSVVKDPLMRKNTGDNLPAIVYIDIVPGTQVDITVSAKGFGCENVSKTKMFRPTESKRSIEDFIVEAVKDAGSMPCPPIYIGIGIGGTLDKAVFLSKEAILEPIGIHSKDLHIATLEKSILERVNKLKIGPAGIGGKTTALGVRILTYPTHIAGLPVAVNISCHATRSARKVV